MRFLILWMCFLGAISVIGWPTETMAQDRDVQCFEDVFCVETEVRQRDITFYIDNRQSADVTIRFNVKMENLRGSRTFPHVSVFSGEKRSRAFRLRIQDENWDWHYDYTLSWIRGNVQAEHDAAAMYHLPYADTTFLVSQGYLDRLSHEDTHAIDWAMPIGTPILAARGGTVIAVEDRYRAAGIREELRNQANYVAVQHEDGTIGRYVHLQQNGALVRVGAKITAGKVIGLSGNTGFSTGPHLHFEVYTINRQLKPQTIPVLFTIESGQRVQPRRGDRLRPYIGS